MKSNRVQTTIERRIKNFWIYFFVFNLICIYLWAVVAELDLIEPEENFSNFFSCEIYNVLEDNNRYCSFFFNSKHWFLEDLKVMRLQESNHLIVIQYCRSLCSLNIDYYLFYSIKLIKQKKSIFFHEKCPNMSFTGTIPDLINNSTIFSTWSKCDGSWDLSSDARKCHKVLRSRQLTESGHSGNDEIIRWTVLRIA